MVKRLITEISEEDFRKLFLKVSRNERVVKRDLVSNKEVIEWKMCETPVNQMLDEQIAYILDCGYESDLESLKDPVTLAIHEPGGYYMDKFMNRYTGAQTFQLGFGIKHLYSTRDYYEARDGDYWRVNKKETKVIYRIHLSKEWQDKFVLKHKKEEEDWPFNELPEGVNPDYISAKLVVYFDREGEDSVGNVIWKPVGYTGVFCYGKMKQIIPVDREGKKLEPDWAKLPTGPGVN